MYKKGEDARENTQDAKTVLLSDVETYCGIIFCENHPYAADMVEAVDLYIRSKEAL